MKKIGLFILMLFVTFISFGCKSDDTVYKVSSDIPTATLYVGDTVKPVITVEPVKDFTWTTDKEGIVKIENGEISALAVGTVRVKAVVGDYFAIIDVTVKEDYLEVLEAVTVKVGEFANLNAKSSKAITYTSNDNNIATVNTEGKVSGVSKGTTTIKVVAAGIEKSVNVEVKEQEAITVKQNEVAIEKGETFNLEIAANCEYVVSSSDENVVKFIDGVLSGVGKGTANVTIKSKTSDLEVVVSVVVTETIEEQFKLSKSGIKLSVGGNTTLTCTAKIPVVWTSDDNSIVTVVDGVVTAVGSGTTYVRATSESGKTTAACKIVVEEIKIELSYYKGTVAVGKTMIPITKNNAEVTWSSSDTSVLKVDSSGNVTGVNPGTADVIMKSVFGEVEKKFSIRVYVEKENEELNAYLDELFLEFIGDDPYSINTYLYHPEKYNIEEKAPVPSEKYTIEDEAEYFNDLRKIKEKLLSFNYEELPRDQQVDIDVILDYVNKTLAYDGYYYYGTSFGSYLGYQSQLPMVLAEYRFDNKKDIDNYLEYIKNVQADFEALVDFEYQKLDVGNGLPDGIIDRVIDQCNTFLNSEESYLIVIFDYNISQLDFLTEDDRLAYSTKNSEYIDNYFMPAYSYLVEEMTKLRAINNDKILGGYAIYNNNNVLGKDYYEIKFQDEIGTDMTAKELIKFLDKKVDEAYDAYVNASAKVEANYNSNLMTKNKLKLEDLVPYYMNLIKKDFPVLKVDFKYTIKEVHKSMEDNFSPAAYFISPIDDNVSEVIYINPKDFSETNTYMYQTIAHEGYPGHMFQNIYKKNSSIPDVRKILHFGGYAEGWAVYIENYILKYTFDDQETLDYFSYADSLTYLIIGRADVGVNYEGWTQDKLGGYLTQYFNLDAAGIKDMYLDLIEIPTNYLKYYFSYYTILNIKEKFKKDMGSDYSDLLFHTIFLETGPCSFNVLSDVYEQYALDYKNMK